tara:strand:+ start:214 stop:417 length:204 start_codon:yes stop_codon:yes gene_type:complete
MQVVEVVEVMTMVQEIHHKHQMLQAVVEEEAVAQEVSLVKTVQPILAVAVEVNQQMVAQDQEMEEVE